MTASYALTRPATILHQFLFRETHYDPTVHKITADTSLDRDRILKGKQARVDKLQSSLPKYCFSPINCFPLPVLLF
jgi:hypothetical protein